MNVLILLPLGAIAGAVLAQSAFDPTAFLPSLAAQSPVLALLVWIVVSQQKRNDVLAESVTKQGLSIDRLARSVLVLSLRLGGDSGAQEEAKGILRDIGENTPR